ncbi:MAG: aminopeptidase N, partial [Alphaproteobacteria bacterium]|nr:aminopeptidase N [Alphaproteobacteria bacterium]
MIMRTDTGAVVRLQDYRVPDYLVDHVDLVVELHETRTSVTSTLNVRPNPAGIPAAPLQFDGDGLEVTEVLLDGAPLSGNFVVLPDGLTIASPPQHAFKLQVKTIVDAAANLTFSGLYLSNGVFCTQCEAEGFRRITYFPDRPDILSTYRTKIIAPRAAVPVLLGNGNPVDAGELDDGRHFTVWDDPFPKPCYLFALVGGRLDVLEDEFTTCSGRRIKLGIYVEPGKAARASFAMDALKRSMKWDEDVFGREYDLDVFNIAAVSDFNMGAMENKGLNIFNDKYILASPETATDADYENIERIVAHEYFHNWTGNRITCRDWFQLCLKEGLTVYRDQEFSADQDSRAVKRIKDVRDLQSVQFAEDAGPLAHNVRPDAYREINNFYTATVYEKGAEVIRTLKLTIGEDAFARGMTEYFERYDGTAATLEDFIGCFVRVSGRDLTQFMRWYNQAGTPHVRVITSYEMQDKRLRVRFDQSCPPTPGQSQKEPFVIPIAMGLISREGMELDMKCPVQTQAGGVSEDEARRRIFILESLEREIIFENIDEKPVLSLLRDFSAPVKLEVEQTGAERLILMTHDVNPFTRWQAAQGIAMEILKQRALNENQPTDKSSSFCDALAPVLRQWCDDPAYASLMLNFPGDHDIAREIGENVNPAAIFDARLALVREFSQRNIGLIRNLLEEATFESQKHPGRDGAKFRTLLNQAVSLIWYGAGDLEPAVKLYESSPNMTVRFGALGTIARSGLPQAADVLTDFEATYGREPLVLDKWFALQATIPGAQTLRHVERLMQHPAFSITNPNRLRALAGSFCMGNPTGFHAKSGEGYLFLTRIVTNVDKMNPQ